MSAVLPSRKKLNQKTFSPSLIKNNAGFTLIEMVVVVAIIGILTAIAIASYNSFSQNQSVKLAAQELKTDLRVAKTDASAGRKAAACRVDTLSANGTNGSDQRDDFSLIGNYLTFQVGSGVLEGGQRCSGSSIEILNNFPATNLILADQFNDTIRDNVTITSLEGLDGAGSVCYTAAPGDQVTVFYFSINANPDTDEPNTHFYDGVMVGGVAPAEIDPCINSLRLTLERVGSATVYDLIVENNGNVYEVRQ